MHYFKSSSLSPNCRKTPGPSTKIKRLHSVFTTEILGETVFNKQLPEYMASKGFFLHLRYQI